jgi:hypothetical protein
MEGPSDDFRVELAHQLDMVQTEEQLDNVLAEIEDALAVDAEQITESADDVVAVMEWASVSSYAMARFYGPASPLRKDLAGYGKKAVKRLTSICDQLRGPLQAALRTTGASSFSISVGFPWGISVSLTWP